MKTILHLSDIAASREKVFEALTTTAGLAGWWTTNVKGQAGADGVIDFTFGGAFNPDMQVVEFEPQSRVSWKCVGGHKEWDENSFSFALEDRDGATRLRFRQDYAIELGDDDYAIYNYNWGFYLESLRLYCETGTGKPYAAEAGQG
jgi:uncharacterized protein YndB with AHSA1/START domain